MCFDLQDDSFVVLALHCAAAEGNAADLQELLSFSTVDMNAANKVLHLLEILFLFLWWLAIFCCKNSFLY
jgi:hypothetical protein